ncbi:hypothetical protein NVP1161O_063 [Vibrio phage 1.161.O._10N.261.48.C5]|nr:hypothetical protein NVP1161O_063 [Vibrio phage 1.161.O._10N.261.48.C5]
MQFLNFDVDGFNLDQYLNFTIDTVPYLFRFRYNARDGWYVAIYDPTIFNKDAEDNKPAKLYGEVKVMPFQNILKHTVSDKLPRGYLSFTDTKFQDFSNYAMPSFDNIGSGKRFQLTYFTYQESVAYGLEKYL